MSSKTKTAKQLASKGKSFSSYLRGKQVYVAQINEKRSNHVSEADLSPGGKPFHFKGQKEMTPRFGEQNWKNKQKRARKQLRAA